MNNLVARARDLLTVKPSDTEPRVPQIERVAVTELGNGFLRVVIGGGGAEMGVVTETIYAFLVCNSVTADRAFDLPPQQVIEIGTQIDL